MGIREALVKTANQYQGGMEGLSHSLGQGANGLRNRIYELKGQQLHLQTACLMQAMTKTTFIAEAIAVEAGGVFVKLPDLSDIDRDDLLDKLMRLHADIGDLSKKYFEATRDDEIDSGEKQDLTALRNRVCKTLHEWLTLSFSIYCRD